MTFVSALLLGLLASAHCAGMCGGLQAALQQPNVIRTVTDAHRHLIALNLGRLTVYVIAGLLFSLFGSILIKVIDVPRISQFTRYLTALVLVAIGVQLLMSKYKPFVFIEKYGAALWRCMRSLLPVTNSNYLRWSFYRGLIWGFLPCGLIYGVLMTTLFADSMLQGGLIMLGFGLGTFPAMVLTGGLYQQLRRIVRNRAVQLVGGLIFIQGGLLMLLAPWFTGMDFMHSYPQIMSTMFCIN